MAHDVFICHSAKDKATADAVCAVIESNGVRCWIAPRDVTAGMEWSECIIDAIEECRVMVLVFTTNANESPQIRREVERAVNRGVAILPLRIEDILPGRALEYFIGNVHWLDALTPPLETHLQNLAGTVKILLGRLPAHGAPIPHSEPIPQAGVPPVNSEWTEPNRPVATEPLFAERPLITERREEIPPWTLPAPAATPIREQAAPAREQYVTPEPARQAATTPVAVPRIKRIWPPVGVIIVAVLGYLAAAVLVIGTSGDISSGHGQTLDLYLLIFAGVDVAAGIGLMKLRWWGRALKITHAVVATGFMISIVENPYREGSSSLALWVVIVAYLIGVTLYMFNAHVKQVYRRTK
jgi:TIR domain